MSWPPVWEDTFADPAREAAYKRRLAAEVHGLTSTRKLSPKQKDTICWVLFNMDQWASALIKDLGDCPWTPLDRLRGPMPPLKTERERKKWERCRWLLDGHDACWATRDAILAGDWIEAISWAMTAGSRLHRDRAATGRARGAALSSPNKKTDHAAHLAKRNTLILREAANMRKRNSRLKLSDIAARLSGRAIDQMELPSAEAIRKILRAARKDGNI